MAGGSEGNKWHSAIPTLLKAGLMRAGAGPGLAEWRIVPVLLRFPNMMPGKPSIQSHASQSWHRFGDTIHFSGLENGEGEVYFNEFT